MFSPSVTARSVESRPRTTRRHQHCLEGGNSDTFRLAPLLNGPPETFGGKGNVLISSREASPLPGAVSLREISSTLTLPGESLPLAMRLRGCCPMQIQAREWAACPKMPLLATQSRRVPRVGRAFFEPGEIEKRLFSDRWLRSIGECTSTQQHTGGGGGGCSSCC